MFLTPIREGVRTFDLVVFYDRANGLRFPNEEMKLQFQKDAGLGATAPPSGGVFNTGPAAGVLPRDPASAFELIEKVLKTERKAENGRLMHTVVVIDYAESIFPAGTWGALTSEDRFCLVKLLNWARDPKIMASDNPIILVADSAAQINEAITASASRIELLEMMLPSPTERESFIDYIDRSERAYQREYKKPDTGLQYAEGFDAAQFAHLTAGLKKMNIEDIKLSAARRGEPISADIVKTRKREIYIQEYQSQLEVIEPEHGFEVVGGMEWLG